MRGERLALQVHRVKSDVNQHLDALRRGHRHRVQRIKYHGDLAIGRCVHLALCRNHRKSITEYLLREGRIRYLCDRNHLAITRRVEDAAFFLTLEKSEHLSNLLSVYINTDQI